jgi:predicted nucleotidyltransferase
MTNTFTLTKPLFSVTEALLHSINRICAGQGISYFIAGATAREILIHHVYGRSVGRRTRDIDFAVFVEGWGRFDALKNAFTAAGAVAIKGNVHRLILNDVELDIIPFGGVAEGNKVAWPPDREVIMAVDGFEEAFKHTVLVELQSGENIPLCSLPGLAMLKLFAWRDRGAANAKDASDLYKIISEYGVIEGERIYESPVEGSEVGWDPVRMGAILLGNDIAMICAGGLKAELLKLNIEHLSDAIVRQSMTEDAEYIGQILNDFWFGIRS